MKKSRLLGTVCACVLMFGVINSASASIITLAGFGGASITEGFDGGVLYQTVYSSGNLTVSGGIMFPSDISGPSVPFSYSNFGSVDDAPGRHFV